MFSNKRWIVWTLTIALIAGVGAYSGCRKPAAAEQTARRVALLPFEYQGSDLADRWLSNGLEAAAADQMRGITGVIPVRATDAGSAAAEDATEAIRGIVSGSAQSVRLQLYLEDLRAGRVRPLGDGRSIPITEALPELRKLLDSAGLAGARFSTSNPKAFEAFGRALDAGDSAQSAALLAEAVAQDPGFTSAALRLASLYQRTGDHAKAEAEVQRLLSSLSPDRILDRAYADLQLATFQANGPGIEAALAGIIKASPGDLDAANRLAVIYQQRRRYNEAVTVLREMAVIDRTNYALWNQIVYAEMFSGNRPGAQMALEEYRKLRPRDPNVDDSTGDVSFFFGDFSGAAESYERANHLDPNWQNGFPLLKAAWSRMLADELDAADAVMARYVAFVQPSNRQLSDLRMAQWLFLRGQRAEARSRLTGILGESGLAPGYRGLIASQLYVWDIAEGHLEKLLSEFRARTPRYGLQITPAFAALLAGSAPGLTPAKRVEAISHVLNTNAPEALVAAATFLDAQLRPPLSAEGMQALAVADQAIPEASAMFTHALAGWGYLERGEPSEAALIFARRIPPVASDDGILWPLVFPARLRWELDAWEKAGQPSPLPQLRKLVGELAGAGDAASAR